MRIQFEVFRTDLHWERIWPAVPRIGDPVSFDGNWYEVAKIMWRDNPTKSVEPEILVMLWSHDVANKER